MFRGSNTLCKFVFCGWLAVSVLLAAGGADAGNGFRVLYKFCSKNACTGGVDPEAGLIADKAGNLYGTTTYGGQQGVGVVFRLAPDGTETVLHSFAGGGDGAYPDAGLIADEKGNLYGTTYHGGGYCDDPDGCGTVFKLKPDGTEVFLHSFVGGSDGRHPLAGLIEDSAGNLYGTTFDGGSTSCGVIFKLAPDETETVLYAFAGIPDDGCNPAADLMADKHGNIFGTTEYGGHGNAGVVFVLGPGGERVLYSFCAITNCVDGANPVSSLITDKSGNLYGTTTIGGGCKDESFLEGCGVVFKLVPDGTESVLHSFDKADGAAPSAGLIADKAGNLYGTTFYGGGSSCYDMRDCGAAFEPAPDGPEDRENRAGFGAVFKLAPDGKETVLYAFPAGIARKGCFPRSRLIVDARGYLYGTASGCGGYHADGTVFALQK